MGKLGERTGAILVENLAEAKEYYKKVFGLTDISYHGMDMLELNGVLFFYIWEVSAEQAEEYKRFMFSHGDLFILYATLEFETPEEMQCVFEKASKEGKVKRAISVQPWSSGSADLIDKYGVHWYITGPGAEPPEGCIMCHPPGQPPEVPCDPCLRWQNADNKCPIVG